MIREPTHRAPAVLGRDEPLHLSDGVLRFLLMAIVIAVAGTIFALALTPATRATAKATMKFTGQFTNITPGDLQFPRFPERSTIYAKDGTVLATLYLGENRKVVRLQEIAPIMRKAVIAIEDARFYEHGALDVPGIIRAAFTNLKAGSVQEGGSTITQQLVKNVLTSGERTFARKLEEARLAFRLEREYTKDQILELYLNEVYMGRSVNGIEAAAEFYFGVTADQLTLPQAATLAGLIAAPERFNPLTQPQDSLDRRNHVIDRMEALGVITSTAADEARATPVVLSKKLRTTNKPGKAAYFVEYIRTAMLADRTFGKTLKEREHALYQGGLQIHTTLDPKWLSYAKDAVKGQLPLPIDPQSAVVSVDATNGAIRTLLGGTDFKHQAFDAASQGKRQAGSSFKAFTLVAALENGIPAGKVYNMKSPIVIDDPAACGAPYPVSNAEGGSADRYINMAEATADSVNVYFAQLIRDTLPQNVVDAAEKMGITEDLKAYCSLTLGAQEVSPLEMASGYATLANDGIHCVPYAIAKVQGPNGELLQKHTPKCTQVVDPGIVATVDAFLQGVVAHGTGTNAYIQRPMAGKTGTTQDHADGWFVGYLHKEIATAVWVGDITGRVPIINRGSVTGELFGGNKPAMIWHDYMSRAAEGLPVTSFPAPPPIPSADVPDVVGKMQDEAVKILGDANFTSEVKEKAALAPPGTVVEQSPAGGASVEAGSLVTIWVANGKTPKKVVPDVTDETQQGATAILLGAGFEVDVQKVDVDDPNQDGLVIDQDPKGGKKALAGSSVLILVGEYHSPSPSPSDTGTPSPTPTRTRTRTPRSADENLGGGAGGVASAAAGLILPLLLAAAARRRSTRVRG